MGLWVKKIAFSLLLICFQKAQHKIGKYFVSQDRIKIKGIIPGNSLSNCRTLCSFPIPMLSQGAPSKPEKVANLISQTKKLRCM